ncbi:AAA family ATPase [uncultured Muribaculum sp.]|uniref:AAA family ATPase n=1 Tax=uncultured Muribaculum sp. TaxID=1918613 RepID=UPI0025F97575|nr:AAA family ATPase [uncultured Muribaculum sp.]
MEQKIDLDNPEFQDVWKLLCYTRQSVFMTGKAGTGKSTFLKYVCAHTRKKHVVLAPTGIAAVNVGGQTLHSFFKLPFKPVVPDDPEFMPRHLKERMKYPRDKVKLLRELELIIIDEISMVRADMIDLIDRILRVYTGNTREPFGGKQLLLVGDVFQLEPVVTADMRDILGRFYRRNYFFCANAFRELSVVPVELRKVYRQNDEAFISLLDRVRTGRPDRNDIMRLNERVAHESSPTLSTDAGGRLVMTLATRRDMVESINSRHLAAIDVPEVTYTGTVSGDFPESSLPTPRTLTLKVGAQVVFIKNDAERRWVNGTLGRVDMASDDRLIVITEDGEKHHVEQAVWENVRYYYDEKEKKVKEDVLGTFTQYPVQLAWALTIHKSQGLTFANVRIDLGEGAFSSGQAYVALSRCRSLEGMTLAGTINERDIFVNPAIVRFSHTFNDNALIASALERAKADDEYARALASLREGDLASAFDHFTEGLRCRSELDNPLLMRFARMQLNRIADRRDEIALLRSTIEDDRSRFIRLADEYVAMADECRLEGMDPTPVIANYDKALDLVPGHTRALTGKGLAYFDAGAYDEAAACFEQVAEKSPDNFEALYMAGESYRRLDAFADALDRYLKAEAIDADSAPLHESMSALYTSVGDDESSARHATIARKLRTSSRRKKK